MELAKGKIRIRNAQTSDAPILAAWWNDGTVMAHAGFPLGLGTTPEKISADLKTDRDDTRRRLMLEYDDLPIGEMSYRMLEGKRAEIGIKICRADYQEKGIGRIALSLLIRALFERGAGMIVLDTNLRNTRAQHVYETLGFQKTGVRIDSWRDQLGCLQSAVDYALRPDTFRDFSSAGPHCE